MTCGCCVLYFYIKESVVRLVSCEDGGVLRADSVASGGAKASGPVAALE